MKYCAHCGKELFDEAVMCPGCGNMVQAPAAQKKAPKQRKPIDKKKLIKRLIIAGAALLIVAGGVLGFLLIKNSIRAGELESQLVGKTYEYRDVDDTFAHFAVYWISFDANGQYRYEKATSDDSAVNEWTGTYSVSVALDGTQKLYTNDGVYWIVGEPGEEIEWISSGGYRYYPIERKDGYNLSSWFEEVQYLQGKMHLQDIQKANKQKALEAFADISYWNTGDSFDNLIPIIFKDYDLTCEPVGDSTDEFRITVSGPYYINKVNLPTITQKGELVCRVTVGQSGNSYVIEKDDGIVEAMKVYVILSTYGSYGWY